MALLGTQVKAYLDRICLPQPVRESLKQGPGGPDALSAVAALQRHHLKQVPFENLDLMYSSRHSLPQDSESVFHRVVNLKRGGVCDQIHLLFTHLLRQFGFSVYCTGSRINAAASLPVASGRASSGAAGDRSKPKFGPWVHLNTIVTIGEQEYVVDTGHGPSGFPCPVPLIHGHVAEDISGRERRMIHDGIPGWSNPNQKWWRMQIRYSVSEDWLDVWAFTETEWTPVDFQLLRLGYASLGTGWVEPKVCCFRTTYEGDVPVGFLLVLEDELRRSHKGKIEVLQKFYSERDRIEVLEREFEIVLSEEEQGHILGHPAEIQDDGFDYYG